MAKSVLFLGWNRAFPGREQQAMDLFGRAIEYYGQLQNAGKIDNYEPVMLTAHGGDLNGFVLIRGDAAKLDEVRREEDFIKYAIEANFCLDKFGVVSGYIGDGITEIFSQWATHL